MFVIGEVLIEEQIAGARFACDLQRCKGACCTLPGGRGAPLSDDEVARIEDAYPYALKHLSQPHREFIEEIGMVEGAPGSYATACIDDKECVFVFYEDGVARCSLEKAFDDGETSFRKPNSCFLFPIRVSENGRIDMRYEKIPECLGARQRGVRDDIPLSEFLKDALVQRLGAAWYREFEIECGARRESGSPLSFSQRLMP